MTKKILALLFLLIAGITVMAAPSDDAAFEKKLMTIRIPYEVDWKSIPLSDALTNISKSSNVTIVSASDIADIKLDLYFPANQTLRKIIDTIKSTNYLVEEIRGDTLMLMKRPPTKDGNQISGVGKVVGKVTEIDKITGIRGVTLTLGDDMSTLVLSDVGGAFIIDNVKPGSYILKAVAKGYSSNAEIIEVKRGEDQKINLVLPKSGVTGTKEQSENSFPVADKLGNKKMSKIVEVTYGDPKEIAEIIKPIVYLESIVVDSKSNVLLLVGNEDNIQTAQQLIRKLDVGTKQIRIKAKIWDVNKSTSNDLGIKWEAATKTGQDFVVDYLGAGYTKGSGFALQFGNITNNPLQASLSMLAAIDEAQIIAEPMVATMNGETAEIQVVDEEIVGYTESASTTTGGSTTKTPLFKSAGVVLNVTPTIKTDKTILIDFSNKVSRFSKEAVYGTATEKKSETKTKIKVRNGETLRIGGMVRKDIAKGISKIPLLGDIPLIGVLFQNSTVKETNRDLWVELTTEIIE